MSNNLVSQPLSIPEKQMDPFYDRLETSIPNMQMGLIGGMPNFTTGQQFEISTKQMGPVEAFSHNLESQNLPVLNSQMGQMEPKVSDPGRRQFLMPNQQVADTEAVPGNMVPQNVSLPCKRKPGELMFNDTVPRHLTGPNKHVAQMEPHPETPGIQQLSAPIRKTLQVQMKSNSQNFQSSAQNKKMVRNDSMSVKTGSKQSQTPRSRTVQMEPSPKVRSESFESVRSKMRESLAAALELVTQQQGNVTSQERNSGNDNAATQRATHQDSQLDASAPIAVNAADCVSNVATDTFPSKEAYYTDRGNDVQTMSQGFLTNTSKGDSTQGWKGDVEVQCNSVLPNEDVSFGESFFVKDELLQGNGLTWAMDFDGGMGETVEVQIAKKPKLVSEDVSGVGKEQAAQSPKNLAFKIEAELFKLFGGVNKKYKERGRSLLFNLKDRNNPELRERVMSGEIPPEKLCSMTAEELASKELSEWRMAKAEELAQMVVLPDSDVDIRRLVKKTHKGEFQVEVEQDDGVAVEVSVGTSSLTRVQPKNEDTEAHPSSKTDTTKDKDNVAERGSSENQDLSGRLTIPNDGTDLMQGLMVDEFKDAEFLPPIVSLDEFMESLDSEPPFENLPVEGGKPISPTVKKSSEGGNELTTSNIASKVKVDSTLKKSDKEDVKDRNSDLKPKSRESSVGAKSSPSGAESKAERLWGGVLQLNLSAMVAVGGFFKSGERTLTNEWPSCLEIKGRVRLDAFEKFVQELRMSRSRSIMVVHFVLEEGSSDDDRTSLTEVIQSYVLDERLGFAEPNPGVEVYFCPPHPRLIEMLGKHLPKDHTETLNSIDNGLIGIVVWRKAQLTSTISPNSSSHHKHSSKRQHFSSRRDSNMNVNIASKPTFPVTTSAPPTRCRPPPPDDEDDDDIPPGFGPVPARDEDDLPEFNFSGNPNHSLSKYRNQTALRGPAAPFNSASISTSRPVDQVRELIHKYGKTGGSPSSGTAGIGIQPWDDDDDDDIPEWQPQAPQPPLHNYHQPLPPQAMNQLLPRVGPYQQPANMVHGFQNPCQWQQGSRWAEPPGPRGAPPGRRPGHDWRQDAAASRSREF